MEKEHNYVGVDISKQHFDVSMLEGCKARHKRFSNDAAGFADFCSHLGPSSHVVMEASGPYYLRLACHLYTQGVKVSVVNPLVIRRFCQMRLSRTKTDKKDAAMIASYGATEHPILWAPEASYVMELRQLQSLMDLHNKHRTALLSQREAVSQLPVMSQSVVQSIDDSIAMIEAQLGDLENKMHDLIRQHHDQMYAQLQTIPGIGKKAALLLIVLTGGFTRFGNPRQISSYLGICPRIFESGTSVKGRSSITKMGMGKMRCVLYVCAWSAKRCNRQCKELYDRLVAAGKSKRLALIAVANKLIKQAFAIATRKTIYQPDYQKNICL